MSEKNQDRLDEKLSLGRRTILGGLGAAAAFGTVGNAPVAAQEEDGVDDIHPIFGFVGSSPDVEPPVEPDHEARLYESEREQEGVPFPEWHFDPVGLYVEPGDVIRFSLETPFHSVTAYHPNLGFTPRVPDGVESFTSPILWSGAYFVYRFDEPGVYDLFCIPHEWSGMVIRIVAGEATGPGAEEVPEPTFGEGMPDPADPVAPDWLAATVLRDPSMEPETIIERGSVDWHEDLAPETKQFPLELLAPPDSGGSLAAALSGAAAGVDTPASGCAHVSPTEGGLSFDLVLEDVEEVTQAHVHEGARGEDGPVVAPMIAYTEEVDGSGESEPRNATPDAPLIEGGAIEDPEVVEAITADPSAYYVNVHTTADPGGEIRGQIRGREHAEDGQTGQNGNGEY